MSSGVQGRAFSESGCITMSRKMNTSESQRATKGSLRIIHERIEKTTKGCSRFKWDRTPINYQFDGMFSEKAPMRIMVVCVPLYGISKQYISLITATPIDIGRSRN